MTTSEGTADVRTGADVAAEIGLEDAVVAHAGERPRKARSGAAGGWKRIRRELRRFWLLGRKLTIGIYKLQIVGVWASGYEAPDLEFPGFRIHRADSWDDPDLQKLVAKRDGEAIKTNIARGDYVILVFDPDDRVISHGWIAPRSFRTAESGMVMMLSPREAFIYDIWTAKEHRRSHTAALMVMGLIADLKPNYDYVYGTFNFGNKGAETLIRMFGMHDVQSLWYLSWRDRVGWVIPFSRRPDYGPISGRGHYNTIRPEWPDSPDRLIGTIENP